MSERNRSEEGRSPPRWPGDAPGEERLRAGLASARARTGDELSRRRMWSVLAHVPSLEPLPRRRRWLPLGAAVMTMSVVCAVIFIGVTWLRQPHAERPMQLALPHEAPRPGHDAAEENTAFVKGPVEIATGANETMQIRLHGGARAALGTRTRLVLNGKHEASVHSGRVVLEVRKQAPGQQFTLAAGPYVIAVIGTRFAVERDDRGVTVQVEEGVVQVERGQHKVRLVAGQKWTGWLAESPPTETFVSSGRSRAVSPPPHRKPQVLSRPLPGEGGAESLSSPPLSAAPAAMPERASVAPPEAASAPAIPSNVAAARVDLAAEARAALAAGDADRALALMAALAKRPGLAGENAVYEMGRIWRDRKGQPRQALEVWQRYRVQHPAGLLRPEVDLSIVETYVSLADHARALAEAKAFLARHPTSERRAEVERLLHSLSKSEGTGGL